MKLKYKLPLVSGLLVVILSIIAYLSLVNMKHATESLTQITKNDIVITNTLSSIFQDKLRLMGLLRDGLIIVLRGGDPEKLDSAIDNFLLLSESMEEKLIKAEKHIHNSINNSNTQEIKKPYKNVLDELLVIQDQLEVFDEDSNEFLELLEAGELGDRTNSLIDAQQKALYRDQIINELIEKVTNIVNKSTDDSIRNIHSVNSLIRNATIVAIIITFFIIAVITRSLLKQLGCDPDDLVRVSEQLANGKLNTETHFENTGVYASITKTINVLSEIISGIKSGTDEVNTAADQVSRGYSDLSQRTQEQASGLEEVASSMEEMTVIVNQNAANANKSNQLARDARIQAEHGGEVTKQVMDAMNDINGSSKEIANITSVIDDIAFQTNLLSLNAAIEAARAGEHGRGFAVVASEVRNLAAKCARAAKEIKTLIENSASKVQVGTQLVDESDRSLKDIVISINKVGDIINDIAIASQEQSQGINQVNRAVMQMDEMTQLNASLVEDAAAASITMGEQAENLISLVNYFTIVNRKISVETLVSEKVMTENEYNNPVDSEEQILGKQLLSNKVILPTETLQSIN